MPDGRPPPPPPPLPLPLSATLRFLLPAAAPAALLLPLLPPPPSPPLPTAL